MKMVLVSSTIIIFRVLLAAIHQNENTERRQAITKGGDLRWKVAYPKAKKGDHTLKAVMDTCSYGN